MWSLIPLDDAGGNGRFRLLAGHQYKLGRHSCDFNIPGDKSISRHHATLEVQHLEVNVAHPHKLPILKLTDNSKFGTCVQDEKIAKERIIKNLDVIKFGTMSSIFTAMYEPYVVTTSCLDPDAKKQTKQTVSQLGAHMVSDWRKECQLLVMSSLSVTVKVICALVSLKPIVTVQYLEKLAENIKKKLELPDADKFTPPLAESQLNPNEVSFQKDERRKTLFQGKIFIFLNPKQFKKLNIAVELAGGTPMLMEEGTDDNEDDILLQDTTCVMHCDPGEVSPQLSKNAHEWIKHVFSVLKKNGRRSIPDCELGFAVLYCSTNRYCNPAVEASSQVSSVPSQSLSQHVSVTGSHVATTGVKKRNSQRPSASSSHSQMPASETIQVKEEPVSQPQTKRQIRNKRAADEVIEEEAPAPKVARIKPEEDNFEPRVTRSSRSPSPAHDVKSQSRASTKSSRTRHAEPDQLVPSPKRQVSPEPAKSQTSVFSKASASRNRLTGADKSTDQVAGPSKKVVKTESVDPFDAFEDFVPRGLKRNSPPPSPPRSPVPSPRRGRHSQVKEEPQSAVKVTGRPSSKKDRRLDESHTVGEGGDGRALPSQSTNCEVKTDIAADAHDAPVPPPVSTDGWLTTTRLGEVGSKKLKDDPDGEPAPEGGMTTKFQTLLTAAKKSAPLGYNNNRVKILSKNFKRFKKILPAGSEGLPRIIGGSDLRAHVNGARDVDEWFEEEQKVVEKRHEESQAAEALFSWEPAIRKKSGHR